MVRKINKFSTITVTDGYEKLSHEQLIELMRSKDLEIQSLSAEVQKVSRLEKENARLRRQIDDSKMLMHETFARVKEINFQGKRIVKTDLTLSSDELSYQVQKMSNVVFWTAHELMTMTSRLNRSAKEIGKSSSESNKGKGKNKHKTNAVSNTAKPLFNEDNPAADNEVTDSNEAVTVADREAEEENYLLSAGSLNQDGTFTEDNEDAADSAADNEDKGPARQISGKEFEKALKEHRHKINSDIGKTVNIAAQTLGQARQSREMAGLTKQQAQAEGCESPCKDKAAREIQTLGVIRAVPDKGSDKVRCFCKTCHERTLFRLTGFPKRDKDTLHSNGIGEVGKVIAEVYRGICTKCHTEQEISPHDADNCQLLLNPAGDPHVVRRFAYTAGTTPEATEKTGDNSNKNNQLSSEPKSDPTAGSTVGSAKTAGTGNKDSQLAQAWSDCDVRQMDELLQRDNPKHPMKNKVADLMRTVSNANRQIKEVMHRIASLPDTAPAAERAELCMETASLGMCVLIQKDYLDDFIGQFNGHFDRYQLKQLSNAQRQLDEWRKKLLASAQKNAPDTLIRNCTAAEVVCENGIEYLHPASHDAKGYGYITAFNKCSATVGMMIAMITMLSELSIPKSRLYRFFADNGLDLKKQQSINWILGFARAYMRPAALAIRDAILQNAEAVLMDETTLKVRMTDEYIEDYVKSQQIEVSDSKKMPLSGMRRSQVWTLNSSWTSPVQGTYCMLSPTRNHMVPFNLLKKAGSNVCYLTVDGYRGYNAAVRKLNEEGIKIKLTPCLTHLRRPLHQYLEDCGLLNVYNDMLLPEGSNFFTDFYENLHRKLKDGTISLPGISVNLLWLYYLINTLYAIDTTVMINHLYNSRTEEFKRDLKEARQRDSSVIVNCIYDIIYQTIRDYPELVTVTQRGNSLKFKACQNSTEGKILLSFLRCEADARHFIDHPEVELSESVCERALRPGVLAKKSFYIMRSSDGGEAFCDFLTIFNTCRINDVSFQQYCSWLVANVNYRLSKMPPDPTMRMLPSKKTCKITDENGNEQTVTYNRYDKENHICYDKVDMTGLLPHDYARYMSEYESKKNSTKDKQA